MPLFSTTPESFNRMKPFDSFYIELLLIADMRKDWHIQNTYSQFLTKGFTNISRKLIFPDSDELNEMRWT